MPNEKILGPQDDLPPPAPAVAQSGDGPIVLTPAQSARVTHLLREFDRRAKADEVRYEQLNRLGYDYRGRETILRIMKLRGRA